MTEILFGHPKDAKHYMCGRVEYKYSCDESCENDYCRCGVVENVIFLTGISATESFMGCAYAGKDEILSKSLATWFCKQNIDAISWKWSAEWGYYGEELEDVSIEDDGNFYALAREFEKMSIKEKVDYLLMKEYGTLLPQVSAVHNWHVVKVPVGKITSSLNTKLNPDILKDYERYANFGSKNEYFKRYLKSNAFLCLPDGDDKFKLVDGRHRLSVVKTLDLKEKNNGKTPVYVICPSSVGKGVK